MSVYVDEAVVLRTQKLGEADRIVTFLTRQHGRIRAVAKGVRKTTSRFGARLEPCSHVDLQLASGRTLEIVTQAESIRPYGEAMVHDYGRYTAATAMLETAERLTVEEGEPATQQFLLLVGALRSIADGAHDGGLILDAFLLRSLAVAGYAPSFEACARCGVDGPHRAFHPAAGGMVCVECRPAGVALPAEETVRLLAALLTGDWEVADASGSRHRQEASTLVSAYLSWHLERALRSWPLVERLNDRLNAAHGATIGTVGGMDGRPRVSRAHDGADTAGVEQGSLIDLPPQAGAAEEPTARRGVS